MASKSSDVGDSDMPKRSHRVLRLSEKVCIHRKKKTVYIEFHQWGTWDIIPMDKEELL